MNSAIKQSAPVAIVGILIVGAIEIVALSQGMNGTFIALAIGAVCAIVGVKAGRVIECRHIAKKNGLPEKKEE